MDRRATRRTRRRACWKFRTETAPGG
jgi:hypothetical protein